MEQTSGKKKQSLQDEEESRGSRPAIVGEDGPTDLAMISLYCHDLHLI